MVSEKPLSSYHRIIIMINKNIAVNNILCLNTQKIGTKRI